MQIYLNNGLGREEMIIQQIICYIYCPVNTQKTEHYSRYQIIFRSFVKFTIMAII